MIVRILSILAIVIFLVPACGDDDPICELYNFQPNALPACNDNVISLEFYFSVMNGSGSYRITDQLSGQSQLIENETKNGLINFSVDFIISELFITSEFMDLVISDELNDNCYSSTYLLDVRECILGLEFEFIEVLASTFNMGCTTEQLNCNDDEYPAHEVYLYSFQMSKYEVSNKDYCTFMNANELSEDGIFNDTILIDLASDDCKIFFENDTFKVRSSYENYPVSNVNFAGAQAFCNWAQVKLPTEAQWEFAAKGGDKLNNYIYSGSDNPDEVAWTSATSNNQIHESGQLEPNEIGLYDMSGNVSEWCADLYNPDYYEDSPLNNPLGPIVGNNKIIRGGNWSSDPSEARVSNRDNNWIGNSSNKIGFRVVRDFYY